MKSFALGLIFLAGCAYPTKSEVFRDRPAEPSKAVIYIYRTSTDIDSLNPDIPRLFVNSNLVGKLAIGGHYRMVVDPGTVDIAMKDSFFGIPFPWKSEHFDLKVQANETYFIKFRIETFLRIRDFQVVPNDLGKSEAQNTMLLVN